MVEKVEQALFEEKDRKNKKEVEQIFKEREVVELPYKGSAEDIEKHYRNWKMLVHERENGGRGVHGIVARAHSSDLIGPADKFLVEMRKEFRIRDGVPLTTLTSAPDESYKSGV